MFDQDGVRVFRPIGFLDEVPFDLLGTILPGDALVDFMMSETSIAIIARNCGKVMIVIGNRIEVPVRIDGRGAIDVEVVAAVAYTEDAGVEFEDHPPYHL